MWNKIKKILSKEGGKCIIVEENQPSYVVMKLDEYEKMSDNNSALKTEEVNRDIDSLKAEETKETEITGPENQAEVKVEDLPF